MFLIYGSYCFSSKSPDYSALRSTWNTPRESTQHGFILNHFLKCTAQTRLLRVRVIRALDLMKKDIFGASDPYCKIFLYKNSRSTTCICSPVQTRTIRRSLNPIWNEEIIFRVNPTENRLVFELYDENRLTRDDFLGVVTVSLPHLEIGCEDSGQRLMPKSFMLHPRSSRSRVRGNLHLYLVYLPNSINPRILNVEELPNRQASSTDHTSEALNRPDSDRLSSSLPEPVDEHSGTRLAQVQGSGEIVLQSGPQRNSISEQPVEEASSRIAGASSATSLNDSSSIEVVTDPLPPGWDERVDQNGRTYYVDHVNRRTQWDRPSFQLPDGWEQRTDANGRVYYVDHINHLTTWYHPLSEAGRIQLTHSRSSLEGGSESDVEYHTSEEDGGVEEAEAHITEIPNTLSRVNSLGPNGSRSPLRVHDRRSSPLRPRNVHRSLTVSSGSPTPVHGHVSRQTPSLLRQANHRSAMADVQAAQTMFLRRRQVSLEDTLSHSPPPSDLPSSTCGHAANAVTYSNGLAQPATLTPRRVEGTVGETDAVNPDNTPDGVTAETELGAMPNGTANDDNEEQGQRSTLPPEQPGDDSADGPTTGAMSGTPRSSSTAASSGIVIGVTLEPNEEALPPGWQMARTADGRRFFINHNEQKTTWDDPRLQRPLSHTIGGLLKEDADRRAMKDLGPLPPGWEERVHTNGRIFYINHNARTTQWEDPRLERLGGPAVPYSRNYKQKYDYFRSRLRAPRDPQAKFELRVTRAGIFEDSFRQIFGVKKPEVLMHRLWIEFIGEKGLDYGGVQREWFFLLSREMFNPYYGLFEYSAADNYTLQINPLSGVANEDHLKYFKFIGRVVGMAVYHGKLIDGFFIRPFYKMMLDKTITLKDMEAVDTEYYRSLKYILEEDASELDLNFSVDEEHYGETVQVDLIPNGRHIPLTNENKKRYIECIISWRFVSRIKQQMWAFLDGFKDLVDPETLKIFDANELELLICGLQDISVSDWKANTVYKGEYHPNHPVIVNYWKAVYTFTNELRSRLLQFVTGTSRVPMNGFAELWGSSGPQKFTIECWGTTDQLPRAHTWFAYYPLSASNLFQSHRNDVKEVVILAIATACWGFIMSMSIDNGPMPPQVDSEVVSERTL
ncbi:unnamed protein product [Calicophoron daubneyi]|uniref:HECT-type E3 ubiquitin transferase n=1 Tax=Calicophoron daubneyi TaxID=300641 RepID=A0AAV2SZE0_CALDB